MEEEQEVRAPPGDPSPTLVQGGEHQEFLLEEPPGQDRVEDTVVSESLTLL